MRYLATVLCGLLLLGMDVRAEEATAAEEAPEAKPARTTVPYGVLFESSWNAAVGISKEAVTDGGKWPKAKGNHEKPVIEVKKDGVAGNNYIHFRISIARRPARAVERAGPWGGRWGGVWGPVKGMVESEHTYFRYYQRTYPPTEYYNYGNGHFVQDFHYQLPGTKGGSPTDRTQNVYGGVQAIKGKHWRPYICSVRRTRDPLHKRFEYQFFTTGRTPDLDINRWYRIEGHIRWLEHKEASRTVWDMRVYDDKGELVKTSKDWTPHYRGTLNLDGYFKSGRFIYAEGRDPTWMLCYNDPILRNFPEGAKVGDGRPSHDLCAFQVRNDRWCGSVKGDKTPDAEPPKIALVKPAAAALLVKTGKITLEGTASDNTELYDVHWLSSQGLTGRAEGLANWKAEVPLSEGENTITVIAVDKYLNSTEVKLTITRGP
ncbi:MAG: hypothetical protein AMK75_05520 [Planctomycetes bacterium SM23_65]|nr:MAG: hypothetical protein AMK75_05520 [Planctomycetes bacterium SM23_65]